MADKLKAYRDKRDFTVTPEPPARSTAARASDQPLRFVVQKHDASRLHYDLRLEHDGVLKSFAVTKGPSLDPADKRLAIETEDHPLGYGTFEGVIPEGYGAGTVMVWDTGTWAMVDGKDAQKGFDVGALTFELFGSRLTGRWHLQRLKEAARQPQWLLIKVRDEAARPGGKAVTARHTRSLASGRTMAAIAKQGGDAKALARAVPQTVAPMLCASRTTPPSGEYLSEIKYDGYRVLVRAAADGVRLSSRSGQDLTGTFPRVAAAAASLAARNVFLDGEAVVFDGNGGTDFGALQGALTGKSKARVDYVAFDLLFEAGRDLRNEPIETRKAWLKALLDSAPRLVFGDHVTGDAATLFERASALGLEGIVAKRAGSRYRSGRSDDWIKVRAMRRARVVIGGYTKNADGLAALVVGGFQDGALIPLGRVGTGFTAASGAALLERLEALRTDTSPFAGPVTPRTARFAAPQLVADVAFVAFTKDGKLRHAAFKGLVDADARTVAVPAGHPSAALNDEPSGGATARPASGNPSNASAGIAQRIGPANPNGSEKKGTGSAKSEPADVAKAGRAGSQKVGTAAKAGRTRTVVRAKGGASLLGVPLSNPDKVLFPEAGITKRALAEHFVTVAERMLPEVARRPLTLVRCPSGRAKQCFYQRHPDGLPDRLGRPIAGEDGDAVVIEAAPDLVALAQLGVLEIHTRGARIGRPDRPDRLVFDLDPGEGVAFEAVRAAAFTVRDQLAAMDLASFVKTTGGKGLHVVLPIERRLDWDAAKAWTRAFAERMARAEPSRYLVVMSKAQRKGRIFIDYLRNDAKSSAVAPYSPRARAGAPYALPVSWDALQQLERPDVARVGEPLPKADPWADLAAVRQRITAAHIRAVGA